jgi:spore maturation protein CgeB
VTRERLEELAVVAAERRDVADAVRDEQHRPLDVEPRWLLGYLGTYSEDRQPAVERLLLATARALPDERFVVAGPQYPQAVAWPPNVERIEHLPSAQHPRFYAQQRFTLNVTRAAMTQAGWSPSVRLFEAAACGVPVISDPWAGIEHFFVPGEEILIAETTEDVLRHLQHPKPAAIGRSSRACVLAAHTAAHRAEQLERYVAELVHA